MSVSSRPVTNAAKRNQFHHSTGAGRKQLARLFQVVSFIQSGRFPNALELAEQFEVCRRTIYRDIRLLIEAGIPIVVDPELQGYRLAPGSFLPQPNLTRDEAIALLVLGHQGEGAEAMGLAASARDGAAKVVQDLPVEIRDRVVVATQSVRPQSQMDRALPERKAVRKAVLDAMTQQTQLRLWYRDAENGSLQCTKFSLYRLLLVDRQWYLVGRSSVERRVIVVGLPWVEKAQTTDDPAVVPPRFNLERFLGRAGGVHPSRLHFQVWMRFQPSSAPLVLDTPNRPGERRERLANGCLEVRLEVDGLDEIAAWVLTFGDSVEVLAPIELRTHLHDLAERIARRHEPVVRSSSNPE